MAGILWNILPALLLQVDVGMAEFTQFASVFKCLGVLLNF